LLFTVNQVGSQLAGILNLDNLLTSVVALIHESFEYPEVHVFLLEEDELVLKAAAGPFSDQLLANPSRLPLWGSSLAAVSARSGCLQLLGEADAGAVHHPFVPEAQSGLAAPFHSGGKVSGVLEIISQEARAFNSNDRLVLQTLADLVGVAVHNSRTYLAMEEMAMVDDLTGLLNRRKTLARLKDEWERCQRYSHPLALIGLDLDILKKVNDKFGHPTGDRALQTVANLIRQVIRQSDVAGRVGGDEFLLVLPETDLRGAFDLAERLRKACEELALTSESGERIPVTLSLGVSSWPETKATEPAELIRATDQALYRAKQAGRNRTSL
jgi:diguanylate cyclase (GGDEF)-like protein